MAKSMEEFREFVNKHPLLKEEVRNQKLSWQTIYEEWVLYGEDSSDWNKYNTKDSKKEETKTDSSNTVNLDSIKSIMNYVKKLNPDSVNKTLNTVQKVIQIAQTINTSRPASGIGLNAINSVYSDWWD